MKTATIPPFPDRLSEWKYPDLLLDDEGYPTQEALDYIKNWSIQWDSPCVGPYYGLGKYLELINYVLSIWTYDGIKFEDGLLELHTYGWSGNEEIITELKKTDLWMMKLRASQTGGHYYFQLEDKGYTWRVIKQSND